MRGPRTSQLEYVTRKIFSSPPDTFGIWQVLRPFTPMNTLIIFWSVVWEPMTYIRKTKPLQINQTFFLSRKSRSANSSAIRLGKNRTH